MSLFCAQDTSTLKVKQLFALQLDACEEKEN
jgi:hypothetical protein